MVFRLMDDLRHHRHGFARILATGGLSGEHDRISAIKDGIGNVTGFRARGTRVLDHRFEHLCSSNDRLAPDRPALDDVLLQYGDLFGWDFHTEIATRHHHAIRNVEDVIEVVDSLRFFELGDDPRIALVVTQTPAHITHIITTADEADSDGIHAMFDAKFEVDLVFFGERWNADRGAWQVDAFVLAEQATVDNVTLNLAAFNGTHTQLDESIRKQDARTTLHFTGKCGERSGDGAGGAEDVLWRNDDAGAGFQRNGDAVLEAPRAYLRPLQVLQNAEAAPFLLRHLADAFDLARMLLM